MFARKLNTTNVNPLYLRAFVAGRLIPLDKKPGARPIGIGEVVRRIVAKATITVLKPELIEATAPLQSCAGLKGGIEASIHATRTMFEDKETEGVLLVDASNAFNALNRKAAMHNTQHLCPALSTFVRNIYTAEAELFLPSSDEIILSREGTTQGGPESIGFYAVSTAMLSQPEPGVKKVFYADDGGGAGKLTDLATWWKNLQAEGPLIGYFPNAGKTWLITKPEFHEQAKILFPDVNVTVDGHKYLGSFIGSKAATVSFVEEQVKEWTADIEALADIARIDPQLSYAGYAFGTSKRWQFVCRTTPEIETPLRKLEELIRSKFIPAITGKETCSDDMRKVLILPARLGGMGLANAAEESEFEYRNSTIATAELTKAIVQQQHDLPPDSDAQMSAMKEISRRKAARLKLMQDELNASLSEQFRKTIQLSSEKGASSWLTSLPLKELGFRLNKQQFTDAICMRYDLKLKDVPKRCFCGGEYSIAHCLSCKNGGFVHIRHNTIRDTVGQLVKEVCKDVQLEPTLLPVTGEQLPAGSNTADGARSDISALGFWTPMSRAFLDIRVFNPRAQANWRKDIHQMHTSHEKQKKKEYGARILEIEKGSFTPLIFSCTGGAGPEATTFIKRLAQKISIKRGAKYSETVNFIRRRICFDILRTCILSFRGERGPLRVERAIAEIDVDIRQINEGG